MKTRSNKNYPLFVEKVEPTKPLEKPSVERKREKEKNKKKLKKIKNIINEYIII
tara:strand:+ start:546 stop:707 length:162 start_codon:yes stop_codon:yes gene_type:complete